jgi:iron-sulfur cluster repair protein YtfE (RIC family)
MRDLIASMARAVVESGQDRYLGLSETLNMLMQQHNLKEENVLYPMTDQVLGGERDDLIRSMEAVAK